MTPHATLWTSPAPLWGCFAGAYAAPDQSRPAILRFASDEFMEQLLAMLAADPQSLGDVIARPETWRSPAGPTPDRLERVPLPRIARALARLRTNEAAAGAVPDTVREISRSENTVARTLPLKLYQPSHQRHYLVAATLVCGVPGFPDRAIATGGREQVGFVLRRLMPSREDANVTAEFAFAKDATGARWQRVGYQGATEGAAERVADGEELLPLFPLAFNDKTDHRRKLLAGVIPVGRREEYMSARAQHDLPPAPGPIRGDAPRPLVPADPTPVSARKEQLKLQVAEPWKNLIRTAFKGLAALKERVPPTGPAPELGKQQAAAKTANNQLQLQSWLILLDLADFLATYLDPVWQCVLDPTKRHTLGAGSNAEKLFDWMNGADTSLGSLSDWLIDGSGMTLAGSLRAALAQVSAPNVRSGLETTMKVFPDPPEPGLAWPPFYYLLAGIKGTTDSTFAVLGAQRLLTSQTVPDDDQEAQSGIPSALQPAEAEAKKLDSLVAMIVAAIDVSAPAPPAPPVPFAARLRDDIKSTNNDAGWFVLRCAYVRCDCGPLRPSVVSAASQQFQLAGFFDPDAPARPIRIALPLDTTPAGLRKFDRNTAFMMSDILCGQVQRAKGLGFIDLVRAVLPFPLHKDLDVGGLGPCGGTPTIGMICSLSIPIITICALILLIIMVTLLDLIFRWLPWFILCFPVPGLRAKK
jgi:hypothetical protein